MRTESVQHGATHAGVRRRSPLARPLLAVLGVFGLWACDSEPPPEPVVVSDVAASNSGEVRLCPVCKRRFFGGQKFCTVDGTMLVAFDNTAAAPEGQGTPDPLAAAGTPAPTQAPDPLLAKVDVAAPIPSSAPVAAPSDDSNSTVKEPGSTGSTSTKKWVDPLDVPAPAPVKSSPPPTTSVASSGTTSSGSSGKTTPTGSGSSTGSSKPAGSDTYSSGTSYTGSGTTSGGSTARATPSSGTTSPSTTTASSPTRTTPAATTVASVPPATSTTAPATGSKAPPPTTSAPAAAPSANSAELLASMLADGAATSAAAQAGKLTPAQVGALASVDKGDEDRYTSTRSYLVMYYKATGNEAEYEKSLKELLSLPSNQYNPILKLEEAEFFFKKKKYAEAIASATVADRYKQKFPKGDVYFVKVARTYEVMAKAYEGRFTVSEDPEDLDNAIRMWQRYLTHVRTRGDAKMIKMAEENISKLEKIKEKVL